MRMWATEIHAIDPTDGTMKSWCAGINHAAG